MIKTVIFDLDFTLMDWEDEYIFAITNVINRLNLGYSKEKIKEIDDVLVNYENEFTIYENKKLCEFLNKKCNVNLPIEFVDMLIKEQTKCYREFTETEIETLEYLKNKYELIVLSNWFTYTQKKRLENAGILKYFSKVSGGDERELKPSLKAFDIVDNKKECVMIGDSINNDILPAIKLGMQAILMTKKNVKKDLRYRQIRKLEDLKEML
ncbi:MAG: HAD family hydrolase [Bacilli bacterium]|nr:HAD family hydrolase [Bacilli bacterium]